MTDSILEGKCQYCRGFGVALAREDGTLFKTGEVIINENPRIIKCPCGKDSAAHNPVSIELDVDTKCNRDVKAGRSKLASFQ